MKDLGMGIQVVRSMDGVSLSQMKYGLDVLEDTCILGSRPVDTVVVPMSNVVLIR